MVQLTLQQHIFICMEVIELTESNYGQYCVLRNGVQLSGLNYFFCTCSLLTKEKIPETLTSVCTTLYTGCFTPVLIYVCGSSGGNFQQKIATQHLLYFHPLRIKDVLSCANNKCLLVLASIDGSACDGFDYTIRIGTTLNC